MNTRRKRLVILVAVIVAVLVGGLVYAGLRGTAPAAQALLDTPAAQLSGLVYIHQNTDAKTIDPKVLDLTVSAGKTTTAATIGPFDPGYPQRADIIGQTVAFIVDDELFVSTDGGASYAMIYGSKAADRQLISAKLSLDAKRVAISEYATGEAHDAVIAMDLNGQNQTKLFDGENTGTILIGLTGDSVIYRTAYATCYDSPLVCAKSDSNGVKQRNLSGGAVITLVPDGKYMMYSTDMKLSSDGSHLVYVGAKVKTAPDPAGGTDYTAQAPYLIESYSLASKQTEAVASTTPEHYAVAGFLYHSNTPYYSVDNLLYAAGSSKPIYTADGNIRRLLLADSQHLIFVQEDKTDNRSTYARMVDVGSGDSRKLLDEATVTNNYSDLISSVTTQE